MKSDYDNNKEFRLLNFVQASYGLEVFTPGLNRTRPLYLPFIELVQKLKTKVTIVAGTNGKGQTAHTLAHFLEAAQLKTALWTSPHILSIRERFQLNGQLISYEELEDEIQKSHLELKTNFPEVVVSFYEFLFFVFLNWSLIKKGSIDHLVLEVGLGGRLDAVNHFEADCACITSISRDHQMILGKRYDQILGEKIAVAREGKALFTQFRLQYLNTLTEKYCQKHNIKWFNLKPDASNYFQENQFLARELYHYLEPEKMIAPMKTIPHFKGRIEEMTFNTNTLIFIGAHNIEGVRRMTEIFSGKKAGIVPSVVLVSFSNRPVDELKIMLKALNEFFKNRSRLVITIFDHPKAIERNILEKLVMDIGKGKIDFVTDWKTEIENTQNQHILVCGSYYFIGEVQRFII